MIKFLIAVVLYKKRISDSKTLSSLADVPEGRAAEDVAVFLQDNSPEPQPLPSGYPFEIEYHHDRSNPGIAEAYNAALGLARAQSFSWLILLDDDTVLTRGYFDELRSVAADTQPPDVYVPRIFSGERQISPHRVGFGRLTPVNEDRIGMADFEVNAINSGTAIRVDAFNPIGSFNPEFPLDFQDYWLFHEFHAYGLRVYLGRSVLQHDLSVLDYERNVSLSRYRSIVESEHRFVSRYKPATERILYRFRLLARAVKQRLTLTDNRFAGETLKHVVKLPGSRLRSDAGNR